MANESVILRLKQEMSNSSLGMAVLSWRSPETVRNTVTTYLRAPNFLNLFDRKLIYFQEQSAEDLAVARMLSFEAVGNDKNIGILGGFEAALREIDCEYVLMLENDCPLAVADDSAVEQIRKALADMTIHNINVCRLRHLRAFGEAFWDVEKFRKYYSTGNESVALRDHLKRATIRAMRPLKASQMQGRSVYVVDRPEECFPNAWQRLPSGNLLSDSWYLNWTNQSIIVRRSWCLTELLPWVRANPSRRRVNGFQDIEKELNSLWWRRQRWPILVASPGVFTHVRLDR